MDNQNNNSNNIVPNVQPIVPNENLDIQNQEIQPSVTTPEVNNVTPVQENTPVVPVQPEPVSVPVAPVENNQPEPVSVPTAPTEPVQPEPVSTPAAPVEPVQPEPVSAPAAPVEPVQPEPVSTPATPVEPAQSEPVSTPATPVEPVQSEPVSIEQPKVGETPAANASNNTPKKKKNLLPIIGAVVGIIIIVIAALYFIGAKGGGFSINKSKYKKTLTCTFNTQIGVKDSYTYYLNDGSIAMSQTTIYDMDKLEFSGGTPDEFVNEKVTTSKEECAPLGCTVKYNYTNGKTFELTVSYPESVMANEYGSDLASMTADDMYSKLKTNMEAKWYTCSDE